MSTSGKDPAYHHGDLRDALVQAGLAILAEGVRPAALSLREAARRAGVSAMAPYRHFADKDALLAAVAAVGFDGLAHDLRQADASAATPTDALLAQGVAYVSFACAQPSLFRLMFATALPKGEATLQRTGDDAFTVLADRVGSLSSAKEAADRTIGMWAIAHGLASLAIDGRLEGTGAAPTDLAARVLRLFQPRTG